MCDGALLSWWWLNCLPMVGSEFIPCFGLLVWAIFAFPIKLSLSQSMTFPAFTLPILSLISLVWEWARACVVLGCWLELTHDTAHHGCYLSPSRLLPLVFQTSITGWDHFVFCVHSSTWECAHHSTALADITSSLQPPLWLDIEPKSQGLDLDSHLDTTKELHCLIQSQSGFIFKLP